MFPVSKNTSDQGTPWADVFFLIAEIFFKHAPARTLLPHPPADSSGYFVNATQKPECLHIPVSSRARDGIRTRDPNLGKVVLHPWATRAFLIFYLVKCSLHLTNDTIQELPSFVNTYFQFFSKKSKNIYDSPNFRPSGGSSRFTPVPTVRPRVASYLRCRYEAARGRPSFLP